MKACLDGAPIRLGSGTGTRDFCDGPQRLADGVMTTIYADGLERGDIVDYHGQLRLVTHVDRRNGWAWPIAFDDAGWAMALGHVLVVVHRPAA